MKNFALALQSALRAPHIRQTIFGEEQIRTAESYHLLGWTQYELSCLNSAMQSVWRALYIRRRLLGGEHPDIADSQRLFRLTGCMLREFTSVPIYPEYAFAEENSKTAELKPPLQSVEHALIRWPIESIDSFFYY